MTGRRSKWFLGPAALVAAAALALGACGGDEEPAPVATEEPTVAAPSGGAGGEAGDPAVAAISEDQATVASTLAAVDIINSTGFHGIAGDLAEATELPPRLGGTVANVMAMTETATFPASLSAEVEGFAASLESLSAALDAGDLEAARNAAEVVHETQHDLSVAAYAWLAGQSGGMHEDAMVAMPGTMAATGVIASAGFHGIAGDLAEATEINPRLAGTVQNVLTAVEAATWPAALEGDVVRLEADLEALVQMLDAEDLDGARAAAETVHESQHDLSDATYAWLASVPGGSHGSMVADFACVATAVHGIDAAGFHGVATELAEATEINPRLAGTVDRLLTHARLVPWPAESEAEAGQAVVALEAFKSALEADDLERARQAAEQMHDAQHDLSKAAYVWMGAPAH